MTKIYMRGFHAFVHLGGFLQVAGIVLLDVMPGADGGFQLVSHHHAGALGGGPSDEQHHTSTCVGECALRMRRKQVSVNTGCCTSKITS